MLVSEKTQKLVSIILVLLLLFIFLLKMPHLKTFNDDV